MSNLGAAMHQRASSIIIYFIFDHVRSHEVELRSLKISDHHGLMLRKLSVKTKIRIYAFYLTESSMNYVAL